VEDQAVENDVEGVVWIGQGFRQPFAEGHLGDNLASGGQHLGVDVQPLDAQPAGGEGFGKQAGACANIQQRVGGQTGERVLHDGVQVETGESLRVAQAFDFGEAAFVHGIFLERGDVVQVLWSLKK